VGELNMHDSGFGIMPMETGNMQIINNVCRPIIPLTLLRYEAIADFYTEEPKHINIKINESDRGYMFEQVLRFRVWVPNQITSSWLIYAQNREWLDEDGKTEGLLLRHVVWERNLDMEKAKNANKEDRQLLMDSWPYVKSVNMFLKPQLCNRLIQFLKAGDSILSKGIKLTERESDERNLKWRDIEINRMFDWGTVHAVWAPVMENKKVEKYIFKMSEHLRGYIEKDLDSIYQVDLGFTYPPEAYKSLVSGRT